MKLSNMNQYLKILKGSSQISRVPKIDMHVYYINQSYKEALLNNGEEKPDEFPTPEWNLKTHLEVTEHLWY